MRYEFASSCWMAFLHGLIVERARSLAADGQGVGWSMCQVFTDPPPHLSPGGKPLAWHAFVNGSDVRFGVQEVDDVQFKVVVDYRAVVSLSRYATRGDPVRVGELAAMAAALRASRQMRETGDRSLHDPRFGDFHDTLAEVTA